MTEVEDLGIPKLVHLHSNGLLMTICLVWKRRRRSCQKSEIGQAQMKCLLQKKAVGEDETHPTGEYQNDGGGNNDINIIDVNDLTGDE